MKKTTYECDVRLLPWLLLKTKYEDNQFYIRVPTEIQKHNSMIFPWFSMISNVISMTI